MPGQRMDASATSTLDTADAFTALLQRHRGVILKIAGAYACDRHDRDDLAQEIAAQLWRAWPKYESTRPFATWMYRIALNVAISHLRSDGPRRRLALPLDESLPECADAGAAADEAGDGLRILRGFVATLDPLHRALLLLYLDERSVRETADVLGISESNVTTKINRLKQRLRDYAGAARATVPGSTP